MPIDPSAWWRLAHPGFGGHCLPRRLIAAIIDLVPSHDPDHRLALLGRRDRLPMRDCDLLDPLHPHRIVDVAELVDVGLGRGDGVGQAGHQLSTPNCHSTKACSSAASYKLSNRPDLPPCPAPMLVLSSSTLSSVLVARSFAAQLAGSQ